MSLQKDKNKTELELQRNEEGLTLSEGERLLRGDFALMLPRLRQSNLEREFLVKAARIKGSRENLTAVDATAGLGEDAILLAAAGYNVIMYERNHVIAELLRDSLSRAAEMPELSEIIARMTLFEEDSVTAMPLLNKAPDVVVLDPMFPERHKSALIKKKFQLLQQLESPCSDEEELLNAAIACKPKKIIIKRPLKGPFLAGKKPSYSIKGKAIRYDCIVLP